MAVCASSSKSIDSTLHSSHAWGLKRSCAACRRRGREVQVKCCVSSTQAARAPLRDLLSSRQRRRAAVQRVERAARSAVTQVSGGMAVLHRRRHDSVRDQTKSIRRARTSAINSHIHRHCSPAFGNLSFEIDIRTVTRSRCCQSTTGQSRSLAFRLRLGLW